MLLVGRHKEEAEYRGELELVASYQGLNMDHTKLIPRRSPCNAVAMVRVRHSGCLSPFGILAVVSNRIAGSPFLRLIECLSCARV
jgi:hypothetical protein